MMSLVSAERDAETRTATGSWHVIRFDSSSSEALLRYTYYSLSELDCFVFSFSRFLSSRPPSKPLRSLRNLGRVISFRLLLVTISIHRHSSSPAQLVVAAVGFNLDTA